MPVKKVAATAKTPATKAPVKKTTTARKTPVKRASTTSTRATSTTKTSIGAEIQENARHIQENTSEIKNNSSMIHVLYGTIIFLMLVIAGLAFYVGQMMGSKNAVPATPGIVAAEDITVTVIDDSRCSDCETTTITGEIKKLPFLAGSEFIVQDFADEGVSEYLQENNITMLPAVIFNTNVLNDAGTITPYLSPLANGQYSLALGAKFDPFLERSDRGFLSIDSDDIVQLQENLHASGATQANLLWVEYSDLGCSACKQFHSSGILEAVQEKYGAEVPKATVGFLSVGGDTSLSAMKAIECMAQEDESLHALAWSHFYKTGDYSSSALEEYAQENGLNIENYKQCLDSNETSALVEAKKSLGISLFNITGTPGNIIINTKTGEYISAGWNIEPAIESLK